MFSTKNYDSWYILAELCEAFTLLMENIYVQFDGMVYLKQWGYLWALTVLHL